MFTENPNGTERKNKFCKNKKKMIKTLTEWIMGKRADFLVTVINSKGRVGVPKNTLTDIAKQ